MALLNYYDHRNRVIDQGLVVSYSQEKTFQTYTWGDIITYYQNEEWEYHRYATKSYRYVGMDRETAEECAAAMIAKYTRSFKISEFMTSGATPGDFHDIDGGSRVMAQVAVVHKDGCMYEVSVSVNEDDSRQRVSSVTPSTLFTAEDARDYDEDEQEET